MAQAQVLFGEPVEMAEEKVSFFVAKVHTAAFAVAEHLAVSAGILAHPVAIAIGLKAVFPYVPEAVFVDISLMIVGTDTGTGSDGTIGHHRTYRHTGLTGEEPVAHLSLIIA